MGADGAELPEPVTTLEDSDDAGDVHDGNTQAIEPGENILAEDTPEQLDFVEHFAVCPLGRSKR